MIPIAKAQGIPAFPLDHGAEEAYFFLCSAVSLCDREHLVTVLVPSVSMFMNTNKPSYFRYEPLNVNFSMETVERVFDEMLQFTMYEMDKMSYLEIFVKFIDFKTNLQLSLKHLDGVLKSDTIMKKLKEGNYDLLLSDPIYASRDFGHPSDYLSAFVLSP